MGKHIEMPSKRCCKSALSLYEAFFYAFLSSLCFSINSILVRFSKHTHAIQMAMYRCMGMLLFILPMAIYNGGNLFGPKGNRRILQYRSISAVAGITCGFVSFKYLPIGEATVIVHSTPVFVSVIARILLKEKCGVIQSITVWLTAVGIILIINPNNIFSYELSSADHIIGVLFGLISLFSQCFTVIFTRKTRTVHYSIVCFTTSFMGVIITMLPIGSIYNAVLPRCEERRWVPVCMAVSSALGQIFYVKAFQLENAGPVATLKTAADIILAVAWQVLIFHENPDAFAIGGTVLVTLSAILLGIRKWALTQPEDSIVRRRLRLLTY